MKKKEKKYTISQANLKVHLTLQVPLMLEKWTHGLRLTTPFRLYKSLYEKHSTKMLHNIFQANSLLFKNYRHISKLNNNNKIMHWCHGRRERNSNYADKMFDNQTFKTYNGKSLKMALRQYILICYIKYYWKDEVTHWKSIKSSEYS